MIRTRTRHQRIRWGHRAPRVDSPIDYSIDQADPAPLGATVAPSALEAAPRHLHAGEGYSATLVATGWPAEVGPAWLEPLLSWPGRLRVALHIEPLPPAVAAARLRAQRARYTSSLRADAHRGRISDPAVEASAQAATDLAETLARGEAKLFSAGLYLTVHARTETDLAEACAQIRSIAASLLLDVQPATWRHLPGWITTLPLGVDLLRQRRTMDTRALAAAFPLNSPDLPSPLPGDPPATGGVLYGLSPGGDGVVWWDRWSRENYNAIVLARSGAGKSFWVKTDTLRNLYQGVQVAIIDPEDEYRQLCTGVGGTLVQLGAPGIRINPLDLPPGPLARDAVTRRGLFLHTLVGVLLGQTPPPAQRAALDRAILTAYRNAGITADPATHRRPAPILGDVAAALAADGDPAGPTLAAALAPWTDGSFADLLNGPSTVTPAGQLIVWSIRQLPDELRAAGTLLALDAIWRTVDSPAMPTTRRLVVVDEAWTLLRDPEGARFLYRLAKASRKRNTGLTVATQDVADVLGTDLGQAVVANAATQLLLKQAPQAIDAVGDAFGLTAGERRRLLTARVGQGLLLAGTPVELQVVASAREHALCTTDPTELAELADVTSRAALADAGRSAADLHTPARPDYLDASLDDDDPSFDDNDDIGERLGGGRSWGPSSRAADPGRWPE